MRPELMRRTGLGLKREVRRGVIGALVMGKKEKDEKVVAFKTSIPQHSDRHYLVVPVEHIPTVKDLQRRTEDFSLVSHMLNVGQNLLHRDAPQSKHRFGFHQPPLNSVNHLHLHCFALPYTPRATFLSSLLDKTQAVFKSDPNDEEALRAIDLLYDTALISSDSTDHCKEHFEEEERELLPLMEATELSREQQEKVLEQCLDVMQGTHSHLFHFFIEGLLPQDAMHYLD
ncbi:Bifunctional adenosine 5'-phosphosulfate phosphorylase/adenylylsulfatase HINT4 [Camellia lanceoleosa]|uniref:Bifunctional adenosine 5'-phosphosulfate phosphorylase/adenylylsulfatase HINT4 n=1 Tax=Camellia lanceoleosa TaxID=1840588 RepID=A0ACC0FES4_9ERIC|nr:Bifunctional adenosine 5'-phosphosulfate phosphorylase/adenylylsulfatase HINT4 [Camellia lanceoleosa]